MADTVFKKLGDHMEATVTSVGYTATTAPAVLTAIASRGLRRVIVNQSTSIVYVNRGTTAFTATSDCIRIAVSSDLTDEIYMGKVAYMTASTSAKILVEETVYNLY
jgi:hypothetical protein